MPDQTRWFILIGVDFYIPGNTRHDEEGHSLNYPSLRGCVQDIGIVKHYLLETLKVDERQILSLTSTTPNDGDPERPTEKVTDWPTYENIVHLLETVTLRAEPEDIIYIHYSGHGARAKTIYPELKGVDGWDEVLVPCDVSCGGRYLRDVKIATLLDQMVEKELILTVVLDCCHSGSATRGSKGPVSRGIGKTDGSVLASDKPDVPLEMLLSVRGCFPDPGDPKRESWLLEPRGYELLAACRLNELAHEDEFDDGLWHGALTYHLLECLKSGGEDITYGMLYQRIQAKIKNTFPRQTPIFSGKKRRFFFRSGEGQHTPTIAIKDFKKRLVTLDAGRAHGVSEESEYAVFPWNVGDFTDISSVPKIRITEVRELESIGKVFSQPQDSRRVEVGNQAVPLKTPIENLRVRLVSHSSDDSENESLNRLKDEATNDKSKSLGLPIELVPDNDSLQTYGVHVNSNGKYELLGPTNEPVDLFPTSDDPKAFMGKLLQLAKFQMILDLRNPCIPAQLDGKFSFELLSQEASQSSDNIFRIRENEEFKLRFRNMGTVPVNYTLFDFQPLWGITQIYPEDEDFETLTPGEERTHPLIMDRPTESSPTSIVLDVLKVFITVQTTSFKCLEVDDISPGGNRSYPNNRGSEALGSLLDKLAIPHRNARLAKRSPGVWATSEIRLHTLIDKE